MHAGLVSARERGVMGACLPAVLHAGCVVASQEGGSHVAPTSAHCASLSSVGGRGQGQGHEGMPEMAYFTGTP